MATRLLRIAREPLAQFLLIGAVLAALFAAVSGRQESTGARESIVVSKTRIATLTDGFARTFQRPPSAAEVDRLIEAYVREEVLVREARKLGLDRNDSIIRERLAQKMTFVLEPPAAEQEPADAELAAFLERNREAYRKPPEVAFQQVYLSGDGDAHAARAAKTLQALRAGADPATLGDPILLPPETDLVSIADVRRRFGPDFARALLRLPIGEWSGPVPSPYGSHLVRLSDRTSPEDPPLAAIREDVARDFDAERRRALLNARVEDLRAAYDLILEQPAKADEAPPGMAPR